MVIWSDCWTCRMVLLTFECVTWHASYGFQAHQFKKVESRSIRETQRGPIILNSAFSGESSNVLSQWCFHALQPKAQYILHILGMLLPAEGGMMLTFFWTCSAAVGTTSASWHKQLVNGVCFAMKPVFVKFESSWISFPHAQGITRHNIQYVFKEQSPWTELPTGRSLHHCLGSMRRIMAHVGICCSA